MSVSDKRVRWTAETILLGSGMFGNIAMSSLSPALPRIEAEFANAGYENLHYLVSLVLGATGLGVLTISPFTGSLVRLFGRRRVVVGAYAAFMVFGLVGMLISDLYIFIASRFFAGAAGAVIVAMGLILIGDFYEGRGRERRIGASHAIGAGLLAGVLPIAGLLTDINWRFAMLVHLAAIPMLLLALASPELAGQSQEAIARGNDSRSSRIPGPVYGIMVLTLIAGGIGYSVQFLLPFHLKGLGSESGGWSATMLSITLVFSILTSFLYAELRRWLSVPMVFALAFFTWGCGFGLTAMADSIVTTALGMVVIGLGGGLVGPNVFSAVSALTTDTTRAHSVGIVKGIYYFGPFFGPSVLQAVSANGQPDQALAILCGTGIVVSVLCVALAFFAQGPLGMTTRSSSALDKALEAESAAAAAGA